MLVKKIPVDFLHTKNDYETPFTNPSQPSQTDPYYASDWILCFYIIDVRQLAPLCLFKSELSICAYG